MALPKYNGGLTEYLNAGTKSALNPVNKVEEIDFQNLIPHENNFYGMRDIPSLAKDMSISNWVEPLRVQPSGDGKYIILSGERRYRAVMYRYERGEISSRNIPCIVTEPFKGTDLLTPEMVTNIAIIMANSHRVKNFSERLQEIAVLEPMARIYYQKAKEEKHFMGRFREYFAEQFLNISMASLHRLRGLQSLIPEFMQFLDDGKITQMVASELAKHSQQEQREFMECMVAKNDKTADFKYSDVKSFFEPDEREAEDKAEAGAEIETKAKIEAEVENEVEAEVETEVEDKAETACVSNTDMQEQEEQEEERKQWTPTSGWVKIPAEKEAEINKIIEEQGVWELDPCMMCRSGTRCVGCCKICQNHCGMRQNCSREQENSRNDNENNVPNADMQRTENTAPVQETSTMSADEMPVEDDGEPIKDALCDTPELPTPTLSPAASVQADISKVNISNEGMNIVISYLQSGLDERKRGLTKADEAGDIELAARYEMEVASFHYAIIKLSKMAEEQSAG